MSSATESILIGKSLPDSQKEFDKLNLGITVEQWVILKFLSEKTDLNQKELAVKSNRDPASITRTLDLLEKKDLLKRLAIPNNRRSYKIGLTIKGKNFIKKNMLFNAMIVLFLVMTFIEMTKTEVTENSDL